MRQCNDGSGGFPSLVDPLVGGGIFLSLGRSLIKENITYYIVNNYIIYILSSKFSYKFSNSITLLVLQVDIYFSACTSYNFTLNWHTCERNKKFEVQTSHTIINTYQIYVFFILFLETKSCCLALEFQFDLVVILKVHQRFLLPEYFSIWKV